MQLRDHPLMSYRGICNWPPTWALTGGGTDRAKDTLRGEIGILNQVLLSRIEPYTRCYLLMEFQGNAYMGTLLFDNAAFCRQIYDLLKNHCSESIKQIGDLDLSQTL